VRGSEPVRRLPGSDVAFIWIMAELAALLGQSAVAGLVRAPAAQILSAYALSAGSLLAATGFWLAARGVAWPSLAPTRTAGGLAAGLALKLAGGAVALLEQLALPRIVPNNPVVTQPGLFRDPLSVGLLVLAVVGAAPLAEEVFYRGVLFQWLRGRLRLPTAAALSGLLFGAAHLDLTLLLPLAVVGAGLAVLYERARSLWPCYAAHACLNAVSLALALAALRG
jgi:membrane protease YdiL (CAAX protease family)